MRITQPLEHCWKLYEFEEDELDELEEYEKHKIPPDAEASADMSWLTVLPSNLDVLILIVISCSKDVSLYSDFEHDCNTYLADDVAYGKGGEKSLATVNVVAPRDRLVNVVK